MSYSSSYRVVQRTYIFLIFYIYIYKRVKYCVNKLIMLITKINIHYSNKSMFNKIKLPHIRYILCNTRIVFPLENIIKIHRNTHFISPLYTQYLTTNSMALHKDSF